MNKPWDEYCDRKGGQVELIPQYPVEKCKLDLAIVLSENIIMIG